jgi:fatty-acyl-CoA synthase
MLQRIMQLPEETLEKHDLATIKCVAASGSALSGDLATKWMDSFGDHLYNIYGSTEVAYASIADPVDLREAPDSAGKPPYGTVVKILDDDGKPVPDGETGRIFVGNGLLFEGYIGKFGEDGRLYVEGRDDEMIVSGGENVFPKEVEDCLARHDSVVEVAAVGVDDDEFGKRLKAFAVLNDGAEGSEDELKDWVKQNLARYKVPREIVFLDELPRNSTGKVLKRQLVEDESGEESEGEPEDKSEDAS